MKLNSKLSLLTILCGFIQHSFGNECEIAQSIYKDLSTEIPECCDGEFIICDETNEKIIELNVNYTNRTAGILAFPESIQLLTSLEHFKLYGNSLRIDSLPDFSSLKNLKSIYVDDKYIDKLPEGLETLENLESLNFSYTKLKEIPDEVYQMTNLKELILHYGPINNSISSEIKNLKKLKILDLGDNDVTGTLPEELCELEDLEYLDLLNNALTGPIPKNIGNLKKMKEMIFENSGINGLLPESLGEMENLESLKMRRCDVSGPIPKSLGNLKNMVYLQLYGNKLNGTIPEELGYMESLQQMLISRNNLVGTIPDSFGNLKNMKFLDFYYNNLTGPIPESLKNLKNLVSLDISYNNFTGYLPEYLNDLPDLNEVLACFNSNLYGYVTENPNIKSCDYARTNICYKEGSPYCKKGAQPCTPELIEKIEAVKRESLKSSVAVDDNKECWAEALGYPCCKKENPKVYSKDDDGEWSVENKEWCGIIKKTHQDDNEPAKTTICSEKITSQGYACCSSKETKIVYTDKSGEWGVENNKWCGILN